MNNNKLIFTLLFLLQGTCAHADDWSFTKIISIDHIGDPSENDGLRPEAFVLEYATSPASSWSFGVLENSEGRFGLTAGYSHTFYRIGPLDLTGNLHLVSNYKDLPYIMPLPTLGVRYHLTAAIGLMAEVLPVPKRDDPYSIFITGINFDF
ncbi:MAG: hypothetical protein KJ558_03310 [Gammaproteobacteria bacterium]|nr:hypothetical protein [Gammaproteobacteria bacterium]MBU1653852.1 hypothetical protein [Gammaproteobacteria bacterium]MBU1960421.1 hypothetical protein [Gammaproteobacteria bacterium]